MYLTIKKLWTLGNFAHENITIHPNERTVYQVADSNPGYLYKFVATNAQDLSKGNLYV
ncbi:MAG: alkaline phosphatase PhoX [Tamlana sp.]